MIYKAFYICIFIVVTKRKIYKGGDIGKSMKNKTLTGIVLAGALAIGSNAYAQNKECSKKVNQLDKAIKEEFSLMNQNYKDMFNLIISEYNQLKINFNDKEAMKKYEFLQKLKAKEETIDKSISNLKLYNNDFINHINKWGSIYEKEVKAFKCEDALSYQRIILDEIEKVNTKMLLSLYKLDCLINDPYNVNFCAYINLSITERNRDSKMDKKFKGGKR